MMDMAEFNYPEALRRLEEIAKKVEDPSTGLDDIDAVIRESGKLLEGCRKYLRTAREKIDKI